MTSGHTHSDKTGCICVIPARAGSKRIPNKNIRPFAGKPIIWHSIAAAHRSGLFEHIYVSTDSEKIAAIAREGGAEVPFIRPPELADDHIPIYDVLAHAVKWMKNNEINIKYLCCIYATAPFVKSEYLSQGFEIVSSGIANRAFTVAHYPAPVLKALKTNEHGYLEMMYPEYKYARSQDLPVGYYNAGQFHWYKAEYFKEDHTSAHDGAIPIYIPRYLAHDIDTLEDLEAAELMFNCLFW